MPYAKINGSDPAIVSLTPPVSDPDYSTKVVQFIQTKAPETFAGNQVSGFRTFSTTVTYADAFLNADGPESLVPLFNLQIWGTPTSMLAADPSNTDFIYQRFQRGIMHLN